MRFGLNEDQVLVRDTVRRFLEDEAPTTVIRTLYENPAGIKSNWWRSATALGWALLALPKAGGGITLSGGLGQDLAIVAEEFGRAVAPGAFLPTVLALKALADSPYAERFEEVISAATVGERRLAYAFAEPGNCWTPRNWKAAAVPVNGGWRLDGAKAYVEAGNEADVLVVSARAPDGFVQLLVPADTSGVERHAGRSLDFTRRFATLRFISVELMQTALVTPVEHAESAIERQLQLALLLQSAETNGTVEKAFELTVDYMKQRYAFGRPIASYQALKHRLADMLVRIHSCMATTDAGIDAFDQNADNAHTLSRVAKAFVAAKAAAIVSDLVQMTGGIAVTWEHDLHLYERRVAVNRAVFGTPEEHRLQVHQALRTA